MRNCNETEVSRHGQDSCRVEELLRSLDKASSAEDLKRLLVESIRTEVVSSKFEDGRSGDAGVRKSRSASTLRAAAAFLLRRRRTKIVLGGGAAAGEREAAKGIRRGELQEVLVEGCGVANTLLAAMEVISSLASSPTSASSDSYIVPRKPIDIPEDDDTTIFPEEAFSVVSLILLRSEERLIQLLTDLEALSLDQFSDSGVALRPEKEMDGGASKWQQQGQTSLRDSFFDTWCAQTVLYCRVIANACRAQQHPLPSWAVASSTWESRLVECAIRACCSRGFRVPPVVLPVIASSGTEAINAPGASTLAPEKLQPASLRYLQSLLRILLSRGGGSSGAESVALGIRRSCHGRTLSTSDALPTATPPDISAISSVVVRALISQGSLPSPRLCGYSSLQIAPLCRALVLIGAEGDCSFHNDKGKGPGDKHPWPMVRKLLATSHDTQDLFVEQTLLGASVPLDVARCVAQLLHSIATLPRDSSPSACHNEADGWVDATDSDEFNDADRKEDGDDEDEERGRGALQLASPLLRQLCRIATLWSTGVSKGPAMERQHVVTEFLMESLKLLANTPAASSFPGGGEAATAGSDRSDSDGNPDLDLLDALTKNDVLLTLMNGVSERLHSTNPGTRRDGMMIGQALGLYVINEPVVFDELRNHEEDRCRSTHCPSDHSSPMRQPQPQYQRKRLQLRDADPKAEIVGSSNESSDTLHCSDDSEWEDDEARQMRYDIYDDEEDLREVPLPLYLNECLDLLRVSETVDGAFASHEAALQALPRLVRERPGDLADVGPLLAKQLVVMENKFQMDDFDAMVLAPLCALTVEEPLAVGHALIEDMFRDGSLYNRTLALTALNESAWELSGNKRLRESYESGDRILRPLSGLRTFGKRRLVDDVSSTSLPKSGSGSQDETRRWGLSRSGNNPNVFSNRFSDIAPGWFYSLVGQFWDRIDDSSLWGGHVGSLLLAHFIQTLSIIVESCGPHHPGGQLLAKDLLELVWNFRDAQVADVRASVLHAIGSCLTVLPQESIIRLLLDSGTSQSLNALPHYVQAAIASDRDPQCRALAEHVASTISQNVSSIGL